MRFLQSRSNRKFGKGEKGSGVFSRTKLARLLNCANPQPSQRCRRRVDEFCQRLEKLSASPCSNRRKLLKLLQIADDHGKGHKVLPSYIYEHLDTRVAL